MKYIICSTLHLLPSHLRRFCIGFCCQLCRSDSCEYPITPGRIIGIGSTGCIAGAIGCVVITGIPGIPDPMGGVVIADIAGIADPSVIPDPIGIPGIVDIPGIAFYMDIASGMFIADITSSLFTAGTVGSGGSAVDEDTALLPSNSSMNCKYAWSLCRLSSTFFRSCR